MTALAALALIAVLYHALNHAFMKSLLFLGTGSVLHATGERNLGRLGGLIHRMPWVAWLTLVGALAIAGLPPLNGFVSEWLLLQAFLFAHEVPQPFVNMLLPLGAAFVALAAALAGYVMVKFFGVIFLGQPREAVACDGRTMPAGSSESGSSGSPRAASCSACCRRRSSAARLRRAAACGCRCLPTTAAAPWWLLVPLPDRQASYAPVVFLRRRRGRRRAHDLVVRRRSIIGASGAAPPWDCGFARLDARMQDTAEGFGQPIRHIFQPFFAMDARAADAVRRGAAVPREWSATESGARCTCRSAASCSAWPTGRLAAAGPDRDLPALQLRHARRAAGARAVNAV